MLIFRQLYDPQSSTYTYLLADRTPGAAILIDPVFEQARRDAALVEELGLTLLCTLETHVHADHVTGAWLHKQRFGSRIVLSGNSGAEGADRYLKHGDRIEFGKRYLTARATPGHTSGCMTFVIDDESKAFTGDCMLIRGCGRTDFQGGDAHAMYRAIHQQIFTLPENCQLYPGHDYRGVLVSTVAEEREFNPRLGGNISEGDFVGYMRNLGLPHPKKIDIAVPANKRCGKPEVDRPAADEPDWAPLAQTFAGIWQIEPHWVEEHLKSLQLIDVREPDEFDGPLGHIAGARLVPLGKLEGESGSLSKEQPVVAVCRSGARSAQATVILQRLGFTKVANLAGGMLRWRTQDLHHVEGGSAE